jgi:hypothetical protein
MPRAYATFVKGDKDVVVYDDKLTRMSFKKVIVSQAATENFDKKAKKHVLDLGRMIIKADGRSYDCIEFKRFGSESDRTAWVEQEKVRIAGMTT